jgi:chromosome segregation protein
LLSYRIICIQKGQLPAPMVHVKCVELSHFKSFGGTTAVPLLPGFTVVSGPNGSGKSNILDALLFCLGLASSKGMRAERLPDLINHGRNSDRHAAEASVSVTFDLSDLPDLDDFCKKRVVLSDSEQQVTDSDEFHHYSQNGRANGNGKATLTLNPEWTVTRRLRVTKGGSYSSNYYINDEPCSVSELHEYLNRLRIYPEGYNVVLQGDVTRIISMNSRERRVIIDEMAGVAEFDRKIEKTKETLDGVREQEERYQIIETELTRNLERLAEDRIKAEKYQKLRQQIQEKQQWEGVLHWRSQQQRAECIELEIGAGETSIKAIDQTLDLLQQQIQQISDRLASANQRVKALGEDEQLAAAAELATQKAQQQQLQQRQRDLNDQNQQQQTAIAQAEKDIAQYQQALSHLEQDRTELESDTLPFLSRQQEQAQETLDMVREQATMIAEASEAWVQEQTRLNHAIADLQNRLNPLRTEAAQLTERRQQLQKAIDERNPRLLAIAQEQEAIATQLITLSQQVQTAEEQVWDFAQQLTDAEQSRSILQETQDRLGKEHREKQRQLDKLEATHQAQQEAQGTYATQLLFNSNLTGICGLVAQLGQVNPRYQLALEIAAGGRLAQLVVEDDRVAAAGIELLKQAKAGRATFLPLNKINAPRSPEGSHQIKNARGFIDFAVNLVLCEDKYRPIFAYVFGHTIVFESLETARPYLGQQRIVTLEGELLEASGAMTGGSQPKRSSLRFGIGSTGESGEAKAIKQRLADLDRLLTSNEAKLQQIEQQIKNLSQELGDRRQQHRELQLQHQQLEKEQQRLADQHQESSDQLRQSQDELAQVHPRLLEIEGQIPNLEAELQQFQSQLQELEQSQTHSEWQQIQASIKTREIELQERDAALRQAQDQLRSLQTDRQRLAEKRDTAQQRIADCQQQIQTNSQQQQALEAEIAALSQTIQQTETRLAHLLAQLGETKQERDRIEAELQAQQQHLWQREKLQSQQLERQTTLTDLKAQIETQKAELPDPLPTIPTLVEAEAKGEAIDFAAQLEILQKDLRNSQKRLEAMEPVNMLALEEHAKTQTRLDELSEKLRTLEAERTELLLRIENFTTLRHRSFKEAFDAVNENFQGIFATLSDGDGYLQLDNPEDPFDGGLNLVAHPKGKPVQRLSSMSGGEKSLTALSFIFALQRYRPSPFYAFDEVDMFLDGANVERLSKMIQQQAKEAQFIVVSLRRPMIEASERMIGVTQARGAHTQVLGIKV